ncbi:altered inheritance of mitochondria protein 32 [Senna tora]|uniref:Altered inheritance of mitochondria protein 32 n=1 Tax=Senna tora TaxID=362788 RepID=A0A834WEB0_9FABA|nr:altered inheritance of mitochondria protein 32 [Senna tora]
MRCAHLGRFIISLSAFVPPSSHVSRAHIQLLRPLSISRSLLPFHPQTLSLLPAMASENLSTVAADDAKSGFTRPEMYSETLAGTVDAYDRHVFLCYKNQELWPPRVEASDSDPLVKLLAKTIRGRKDEITIKTKITVCEAREEAGFLDGDVMIFPQMIKYRGLTESNIGSFVEDVMVNGKPWSEGVQGEITGSYVFVCAHGSRDVRCGVCGPVLIEKLNEEIEQRGLKDQVFVWASSHIGGHKYAGNLIIYSPGSDGKIMGHWYGYVTPNDVPEIMDQHIAKGEVIQRLWRVKRAGDQKLPNGAHTNKKNHLERDNLSKIENVGGCCQGANGVSCCMTANFEQNKKNEGTTEAHQKQGQKSSWNWSILEERKVGIAVAVLGAAAAAAVAYKIYRRSG